MSEVEEYLEGAREFAKAALEASSPPVIIQDAFKATEFALMAYSAKTKRQVPLDHYATKNVAHRLGKLYGDKFGELLRYYLRSYRLEDGERAKRAKNIMRLIIGEVEKRVGEPIIGE